jgi:nitrogen fixation protein NifX
MKVAFATQDLARVDAHLGWARHLMVYEVSAEGWVHLDTVRFEAGLAADGDPAKLEPRLAALAGCALVFAAGIGDEGEHGCARMGIVPLRRFAGQPIVTALQALQDGLRGNAPPWLRRCEQHYRRAATLDDGDGAPDTWE